MSLQALQEGVFKGGWKPANFLASGARWAGKKRAQPPPGGAGGEGGPASRLRDTTARQKRKQQPGAEEKPAGRKKGRRASGQQSKGHSQAVRDAAAAFDVNLVTDELGSGASGTVFLVRCVVRKIGNN